jgi:DNA-binding beta-propeller fold protein YncE
MKCGMSAIIRRAVAACLLLAAGSTASLAQAGTPRVEFELTDEPGSWFRNTAGPVAGFKSLALATPGTEVKFSGKSNTVHTRTSLIYPKDARNMPFDTEARKGSDTVMLHTPGLYVFTCKIHPYMFGAVIVDDPKTPEGLDLGKEITILAVGTVPTASDLATRLLRTFFIATNPSNWVDFASSANWQINYPPVPVLVGAPDQNGNVVQVGPLNLKAVLDTRYGNDLPKGTLDFDSDDNNALFTPSTRAVGEIWVNTQFEKTKSKSKPGTATAIDGTTWEARRKVSLPEINMNNPHNMWTDRNQTLIYQTQWFDSKLAVFDRITGKFIDNISVGESPSHVMTRVDTDQLHVALNGSANKDSVVELYPLAKGVERRIDIGRGNPHAHWMSHDGKMMVTPNAFSADSSQYNFLNNQATVRPAGPLPIAVGMTPDSSKSFVANLLGSSISVFDTQNLGAPARTINLLGDYDPYSGAFTTPVGALPIQTPVSPDGKSMVTANTLTGTILIIDPKTEKVVKMLGCDPGCHGVQYGAKVGGGYYAYVSSKFSNRLIIVDTDPNNNGKLEEATVAGRILLTKSLLTETDDAITAYPGMGGQGILTIPVVYNGWVQNLPQYWKDQLNSAQQNPIQ